MILDFFSSSSSSIWTKYQFKCEWFVCHFRLDKVEHTKNERERRLLIKINDIFTTIRKIDLINLKSYLSYETIPDCHSFVFFLFLCTMLLNRDEEGKVKMPIAALHTLILSPSLAFCLSLVRCFLIIRLFYHCLARPLSNCFFVSLSHAQLTVVHRVLLPPTPTTNDRP